MEQSKSSQNSRNSIIISTGLAVFSMLFGAGNLMYPILVGINSGSQNLIGMIGFILTTVCLPAAGLVSILLYNGDYNKFFNRLGKIPGKISILISMLIIGPIIGIPRIVTLSHTMMTPFLPEMSSFVFALLFLGLTFFCAFRENRIVDILGKSISPVLLISLLVIIVKGFLSAKAFVPVNATNLEVFKQSFMTGYETLDLLGTIYFSAIVINILRNTLPKKEQSSIKNIVSIGLKSGLLGTSLLGLVYIGLSYLGAYHGHGLFNINAGELFREVSFQVLGLHGAAVIGVAVLMACLSTSIALSAVVGEYVQNKIFKDNKSFSRGIALVLLACLPLSTYGLGAVLKLTAGPIVYIGYPMLIALTFANISYKLFDFKYVKVPVLLTGVLALVSYLT